MTKLNTKNYGRIGSDSIKSIKSVAICKTPHNETYIMNHSNMTQTQLYISS